MNARYTTSETTPRTHRPTFLKAVVPLFGTLGLMLATAVAAGQDRIRIVESPRTAMRESRPILPQPVSSAVQPQGGVVLQPVVYVEHFVTEMQDQYRIVYVPIIERQTERTPAWWNPLGFSARTFRPRPVVRWEQRVEKIRVPVRYRKIVPESTELHPPTSTSASSDGSIRTAAVGNWMGAKTHSIRAANATRLRK